MKSNILLHACCGPCSTTVVEKIAEEFTITVFWYNPNIEPRDEHNLRLENLRKFCDETGIELISDYDYESENKKWHNFICGLENEVEGGKRCSRCFEFRLKQAANKSNGKEFFTTTLSVSPHKNATEINRIGKMLENEFGINYLEGDFKKADGYKRSIELSKKYDLYRQDYCGCRYSKKQKVSP